MKFVVLACAVSALAFAVCALTPEQIKKFVDGHNFARDNVPTDFPTHAPSSCVVHVEWDDYLANMAQAYSDTCPDDHNPDRHYKDGSYVGENLAWDSGYPDPIQTALDGWSGEKNDYSYDGASTGVVGHYTQMVWNNTLRIGCGWKQGCSWYNTITCNYWPGGNWGGEKPWKEKTSGQPSAVCPATSSSLAPQSQSGVSGSSFSSASVMKPVAFIFAAAMFVVALF